MGSLLPLFITLAMLPLCAAQGSSSSTFDFHVGIVLDLNSTVGRIGKSCISMALADFYSVHKDYETRLLLHFRDSNGSVVDAAAAALDLLQHVRVDAIIGPQTSAQAEFVMNLGDRAQVPIVSFSATSPSLVPQAPFFVQTSQSDAFQVQAIASIIKTFRWNQVVVVNEDTDYGNGIIPYLSNALNDVNARISYRSVLPKSAPDDFISKELYRMKSMQTRVFVVHASLSLGTRLFLKLRDTEMISSGYAWIVTSGLTELFHSMDFEVVESMQGFLGVKPLVPKSRELRSFSGRWIRTFLHDNPDVTVIEPSILGLWAYDTSWALALAAESVVNSTRLNVEAKNQNNDNASNPFALESSDRGPKLLEALSETRFTGLAGEFKLVDRQWGQTPYQIVNFDGNHERQVAIWNTSFGTDNLDSKEKLGSILWPGDSMAVPKGWQIPASGNILRVGVPIKPGFNEFLKVVEKNSATNHELQVSGFHKEVFESVMADLPYGISLQYVAYPFFNPDNSTAGNYDDLVYQVHLQEKFDTALGDISITYNRSLYADFTMPYGEGGVTCVARIMNEDPTNEFTIFKLLSKQLWITTAFFYLFNALAIWILGRRIISEAREAPGQHPGMICYFPCFPGQGLDANLLCLILVAWTSVSSLLNSTFTASLSSTLVVQRLLPTVINLDQLVNNGDYVGCQEGSFLCGLMIKLKFEESKVMQCSSVGQCEAYLQQGSKNGGISAYCDVMPHIRSFLSQTCGEYMMIEQIIPTEGFSFPFPRDSPLVSHVSRAIIKLTEAGTIRNIQRNWTNNATCLDQDSSSPGTPATVTVKTFATLFLFSGFVTITCLLVSELVYLHRKGVLVRKMSGFKADVNSRFHTFRRTLSRSNSKLVPILQKQEVGLQVVRVDHDVSALKSDAGS